MPKGYVIARVDIEDPEAYARYAGEATKVIAAHGSPLPFLRKGSREELREATGATKLPALKLSDGTVVTHSRAILSWMSGRVEAPAPSRQDRWVGEGPTPALPGRQSMHVGALGVAPPPGGPPPPHGRGPW